MPLLYYWRYDNYAKDRTFGFGYHLNQNSRAMNSVGPGDSLWAFTRRRSDDLYVLAAHLVVRYCTYNPPKYHYGRYRIWGDLTSSRYFDVDVGPNAEPLIRLLSVPTYGDPLGQSFQGHAAVRVITAADHLLLSTFARDLPVLERVRIYPEDEFEARLVYGDLARLALVAEERAEYVHRLKYLFETVDIHRARRHIQDLQELYAGRCQLCLYDPYDQYGFPLCHGHHVQWLSRGGEDKPENMVLVCPNHHAAIHRDDASFDYASLGFRFSNGLQELIRLNRHLPQATLLSR